MAEWCSHSGVHTVVFPQWCSHSSVPTVVLCFHSGVPTVVFPQWCFHSGVPTVVLCFHSSVPTVVFPQWCSHSGVPTVVLCFHSSVPTVVLCFHSSVPTVLFPDISPYDISNTARSSSPPPLTPPPPIPVPAARAATVGALSSPRYEARSTERSGRAMLRARQDEFHLHLPCLHHPQPCHILAQIGHTVRVGALLPGQRAARVQVQAALSRATTGMTRDGDNFLPYNLSLELVTRQPAAADPESLFRCVCQGVVVQGVSAVLAFPQSREELLQVEFMASCLEIPFISVIEHGEPLDTQVGAAPEVLRARWVPDARRAPERTVFD
uniref:Uncharacterized protein n=1 Tax=Knipowitschia caucasica TaxID=637954 RepID=A0AAV2KVC6_KNICA